MDWISFAWFLGGAGVTLLTILACESAYRNGVNDGYMYTVDPSCPGYRKAERILRSYGKIIE